MSIFDVLNTPINDLDFSFTANKAVPSVSVANPGISSDFSNASFLSFFADGDNVLLKKIKVISPYSFSPADYKLAYSVKLKWLQNAVEIDIPELGNLGSINLNGLCEVQPNLRLQAPNIGGGVFQLICTEINFSFSQIGVPTLLDGTDIKFGLQADVVHTKELI